jgi:hypothetical protein
LNSISVFRLHIVPHLINASLVLGFTEREEEKQAEDVLISDWQYT